jgi:CheY-like chemotaxis protein
LPNDRIILIVEDNIDYANSLAEISRSVGFKTIIANSGNLALDLVRKFNPVGVLLDLGLPDISGEQVLKELKSTLELRHIPVSIVSARDKNRNLLEMGAVGYLQKPVEARSIRETVVRLGEISGKYPKNMLIVEDHPGQRRAVMELLSSEGIVCTGVDCEEDAVFELKNGNFDAVIVDMGLRQGNGLNVCRYISDQKMHIPVLIYTGKELTEAERNELKLYSVSILPKGGPSNVLLDKAQLFLHKVYNHSLDAQDGIKPEASGLLDELENLIGVALQNEYKRDDEENLSKQQTSDNKNPIDEKTAKTEQNSDNDSSEEEVSAGQVVNAALEAILANESEGSSAGVDLKGKRILIVDDDVRNVFVITSALENHNAQIFEAFNGKEALDFLKDGNDVDLILMDIMMPVMDGYECMREIRANEKYKNLPIIAVTAKALKGDKQKCLDAGANDYMTKPIDYKVLLALVEQYISK